MGISDHEGWAVGEAVSANRQYTANKSVGHACQYLVFFFALSYTSNANLRDSKEDFGCILYVYFDVEEEVLFHGDI